MSTPSNTIETSLQMQQAPTLISPGRRFYWSVRRELWEHRSIYLAPLAVAALALVGYLIGMVNVPRQMRNLATHDPMQFHKLITLQHQRYDDVSLLIMGAELLVALYYSVVALHGDRRDRGILFWKSLPVSDLTAVLSKASVPIFIIPLVTFVITVVTQSAMILFSGAILLANGLSPATLWPHMPWLAMWLMLLYHLVLIHGLWYAPFFGWLLMVSAWARRAPVLWAALPLLAVGFAEKIAFNTTHFGSMMLNRLGAGPEGAKYMAGPSMSPLQHLNPAHLLLSPGLWIGLALTAIFLAVAVRMRHTRAAI